MLGSGLIEPREIRSAVSEGIIVWGQQMYDQVSRGQYPDYVASPAALAYAIRQGRIPGENVFRRLDHGETKEQFLARADNLVDEVMRYLIADPDFRSRVFI